MKTLANIVYVIAVVAVFATLGSIFTTAVNEKERPLQVGSTVKVELPNGHGSGVNLGNGFILTAGHVSTDSKVVKVKTDDGIIRNGEVLWSNFNAIAGAYDVSVVYVDPKAFAGVTASKLSCAPNYVGQKLRIVGNPKNAEFVTSWGRVGSVSHSNPAPWSTLAVLDATATNGVSGGPVFDEDTNEVVGLLVSGYPGTGYSMMVPGTVLCRMLARVA